MRKGTIVGLGAALAVSALSAADASACSRRASDCGFYAPPAAYQAAPPPAYGYLPPAAAYRAAPPPAYGYLPPAAYGYGPPGAYDDPPPERGYYGAGYDDDDDDDDRAGADCGRDLGYAPPIVGQGYRPAGVWLPGW